MIRFGLNIVATRPTIFPGHLRYASANLDLVLPVHKHNSLLAELRSAALVTIHERYPDQDWLHVFTDGSATASFGRAGAFSNSFNLKEPLSAWSDNFDDLVAGKPWSCLLDGQRCAQLSALSRVSVWHVSESSPDMITCKPICLRLAWLIHRSALSVIPCQ
ncbi:hydroxysteroid dehydrogenase-like protein 1 [Trichonephila clavipes]|nr:hydroxysteroid dehydrogenase-like protein 1 [Trichonephila clavipes]